MLNSIKRTVKGLLDRDSGKKTLRIAKVPADCSVVSFDIFDTLIKRDVQKPTDVFQVLEKQNGIKDFAQLRMQAEKLARQKTPSGEVLLADVYRCMPGLTEEQVGEYCRREEAMEEALCCANTDLLDFYSACTKEKRVVLISDMYLSTAFLGRVLNHCGIGGYEKIYVSGEVGASKGDGLFQFVCEDLSVRPEDILHIGNSFSADYLWAKRSGLQAWKIPTQTDRMLTPRKTVMRLTKPEELRTLREIIPFLNNHTAAKSDDLSFYYKYGYENFGILLVSFCKWLFAHMKEKGIQQALFIARDGFLIKQIYDLLGYSEEIPSYYFEMSRRSIRVPASLSKDLSYEEMLKVIPRPSRLGLEQILDGWGLTAEEAQDALHTTGLEKNTSFWSNELWSNSQLQILYSVLKDTIREKAKREQSQMLEYVRQFHLEKPTALIDIGYNGTIQKELLKASDRFGLCSDLCGYYLMLSEQSADAVDVPGFRAFGYLWDNRRMKQDELEHKPYVGLYESFFLEQAGSIKCYAKEGAQIIVERYPYEYELPGGIVDEAALVKELQRGALDFARDYSESPLSDRIEINCKEAFLLMRHSLMEPTAEMVKRFGSFRFFDSGEARFLARPRMPLPLYAFHPKDLFCDFYESMWKIGFFKALIKVNVSYEMIWKGLKKIFPDRPDFKF